MKKDEKKIVSKEILKSEDTNQVKRRGEKGRKTSSKRRNRVGGMLITSGDFNNLVAMEALPSSPQKDSPAFVKSVFSKISRFRLICSFLCRNDLKKTPVLSQVCLIFVFLMNFLNFLFNLNFSFALLS